MALSYTFKKKKIDRLSVNFQLIKPKKNNVINTNSKREKMITIKTYTNEIESKINTKI